MAQTFPREGGRLIPEQRGDQSVAKPHARSSHSGQSTLSKVPPPPGGHSSPPSSVQSVHMLIQVELIVSGV